MMRRALVIAALIFFTCPVSLQAAERKAVCAALQKTFENPYIQRTLPPKPGDAPAPQAAGNTDLSALDVCDIADQQPKAQPEQRPRESLFSRAQLVPMMRLLFWLTVLGLGGLLLFAIANGGGLSLFRGSRKAPMLRTEAEIDAAIAEAHLSADPAGAALKLAVEGLCAEAVRLLLKASIERLRASGRRIRPDATNREILRALRRLTDIVIPFGAIVRLEERAFFKNEQIVFADVQDCAIAFADLEIALKPAPEPVKAEDAA